MINVRVLALALGLLPLTATFIAPAAHADELMKWERIPLPIPLAVGKERVLFVDKNVRVGFPPALNDKLRVQSSGGAVYLKADSAFPQTRLQLQDVESGEFILLDVTAEENGPTEPVRLVYSGDVTSVSSDKDNAVATGEESSTPGADNGTQTKRKPVKYNAPLPIVLTRYAAQSLYGPVRTVEAVPGIHPVNPHLPKRITTLYPSEPVAVTPLGGWGIGRRNVVALKVQNTASRKIVLDPRNLQGQFVTATFQHRFLGPVGTPEDTTTLYLVTAGRPDGAFVAEPTVVRKTVKKGGDHGER
ncbi:MULTISPECIES: TIGR03749 family integrating conjugative element protein [Brenneria]|uniref:TIGR03749 family integrating conjugative element protein n=1 Tax=Brenneria nigrifluens DSM 30175 = ATCC 13028 TaxID=1121120 RepID=A0A2U1UHE2_9GAMM|nr:MULTISPECIES: TIGR03749 family integrating conjugative element protein [Brenneria]EHD22945.1 integrating conjugative element protein, PFL_4704 family [Brenneria sp. EniD312]MCG8708812.1 TIGR03749 family integrating conjugative element protein [Brenneria bubanii]PWC21037.1 TIGR03749 family integrating conjugative element protein [Brenneria nigrifluens DSM 30175 = ATCC 13028]QCR06140.1 TIGR03749 family integrating conjugative element protein [Brenneria nigrifluens DSM 30175 = ATCC 13028]